MGEEEELNLWCDPFDPCGYLVIYVFMMAIYGSMIRELIINDVLAAHYKECQLTPTCIMLETNLSCIFNIPKLLCSYSKRLDDFVQCSFFSLK